MQDRARLLKSINADFDREVNDKFHSVGSIDQFRNKSPLSVQNDIKSVVNSNDVVASQEARAEVKVFSTKDKSFLDQYYKMRHEAYNRENGWQGYDGSENKYDHAGHIIIAVRGGEVIGGTRIMFSNECEILSNDTAGEDYTHLSVVQKYDKREDLVLSEVSAFVVARNERDRTISKVLIEHGINMSKERGCNYICAVGVAAVCRDYRRILKELGYEMEIVMNRQRQEGDTYNNIRTFPIHAKLS
jgi:N-acyl-L-homoserine lactone synthetase